tara:strand:- start:147936 stop:148418 length:483 start_codon:yes stop_codon:yes gene_type:complete
LCLEVTVLWESMLDRLPSLRVPVRNFAEDFQHRFVAAAIARRQGRLIERLMNDSAMSLRDWEKVLRLWQIDPAFSSSRARTEWSPSAARSVQRFRVRALAARCFLASSGPRRNDRENSTMAFDSATVALSSCLAKRHCWSFCWLRDPRHCDLYRCEVGQD